MGQSLSSLAGEAAPPEAPGTSEDAFTVTVSRPLLETLAGVPRSRPWPPRRTARTVASEQDAPEQDTLIPPAMKRPAALDEIGEESVRAIAEDRARHLQAELEASELVGHLLVNRNQEELAKVQAMADQLVADHYHIPRREPACAQERDACIQCYKENPEEPLRCGDVVRSFSRCAKASFREFVARGPGAPA